ncbi:MAG: hypothetical protein QW304_06585 [Thermoproteota archaeon]
MPTSILENFNWNGENVIGSLGPIVAEALLSASGCFDIHIDEEGHNDWEGDPSKRFRVFDACAVDEDGEFFGVGKST